jgi:hypothetical protein
MSANVECLKTTVVNTSGGAKVFEFLPPYGVKLNDGQEFSEMGTIYNWIRRRPRIGSTEQLVKSLEYALTQGWLAIKSTPSVVLFDIDTEESKALILDDEVLKTEDPCYVTPPQI